MVFGFIGVVVFCLIAIILFTGNNRKRLSTAGIVGTHLVKGDEYYEKKQWDSAIAEYSEAMRLDPSYKTASFNRGNCLLMCIQVELIEKLKGAFKDE